MAACPLFQILTLERPLTHCRLSPLGSECLSLLPEQSGGVGSVPHSGSGGVGSVPRSGHSPRVVSWMDAPWGPFRCQVRDGRPHCRGSPAACAVSTSTRLPRGGPDFPTGHPAARGFPVGPSLFSAQGRHLELILGREGCACPSSGNRTLSACHSEVR